MIRVLLAAGLLAATFADHCEHVYQHDDLAEDDHDVCILDHYGCCSAEERREVLQLWTSLWTSSDTNGKLILSWAMFAESVSLFIHLD